MISGFMIVKNVLEQGYPFVESIASALTVCDEFLVSDGYSTDGTYEILKKIANLNSKVKVYRYKWPEKKDVNVLADVTNEVRHRCRYDYIFSVQANEIIHEKTAPIIKSLPSMFPKVDTFSFPYLQLLNNQKLTEEFRLRFSKNLPSIVAVSDAWTLGTSTSFNRRKISRCVNPFRLFGYLDSGVRYVYANQCNDQLSKAFYLPKPIFRYWSLFPKDFLIKYKKHNNILHLSKFNSESINALLSHVDNPEIFWRLSSEVLKSTGFKEKLDYPTFYNTVERSDHPVLIQHFISNYNIDKYYLRENFFEYFKLI